jgi:hypothetical protein
VSALLRQMAADSPEGLWPLLEASGSAADVSGHGHTLTVNGTVGSGAAVVPGTGSARSIAVPAANAFNRLDCTDAALVPASNAFTSEAWIAPTTMNSVTNDVMQRWGTGGPSWLLRYTPAGVLTFITYNGSASSSLSSTGPAIATGNVYHVACIYDGTNGTLLQNGAVVAGPTAMNIPQASTVRPFTIGCQSDTDGGDYSPYHFVGRVAYCAFYRAALTPATLAYHYKVGIRSGVVVG